MEKKEYKITINAPKEKVWQTLWNKDSYRQWTKPFSESSDVQTDDWKKNSKVLFTDGSNNGMIARVEENIPNSYMSFQHLGELKDGVEDTTSDKVKTWAGAHENYTLKENGGKTDLTIDIDLQESWVEMFDKMWPQALDKVKELAEKN